MTTAVRPGRYDPDNPYQLEPVSTRHAAMVNATSTLRPARSGRLPLDRVLLTLGGICLPVGVIAIIVGWYGVSHTGYLFQQNAYLISGGMLGLGLIFIGGFLYFAYWMTRQLRATETGTQQMLRAMGRLEAQMSAVAAATSASAAASKNGHIGGPSPRPAGRRRQSTAEPTLVATERGSLLHRPDCPVVANKNNLREVDADTPGYRPCQVCNPFDET